MLPMLRPSQGAGLPTLSYPVKYADSVGEVRYGAFAPSISYLPADGRSIKAVDYPEYARLYNQGLGYYTRKLTDPALTGLSTNTTSFASAISPDGIYAFMTTSTIQPIGNIYKIGDNDVTYLQATSAVDGASILGGAESAAFAPNGDYLAFGSTTTPFLTIRRRSVDDFSTPVTISGAAPNSIPTAISITDDYVAMVSHNTAGNNYVAYSN